ncbi:MAG: serine hydrolase [Flavobacteriales bacterium]|nr:serine hydrolase [Flavobacteriales bacterium]
MNDTRVVDVPGTVIKNKAYAYGLEGDDYVERPVNGALMGSAGVHSTVEDLCRVLSNGQPFTYGLGLDHKDHRGQQLVFHGGGLAGYRSYLVRVPAQRLVIAITSNAEDFNPIETAEKAIDLFLAEEISAWEATQATVKRPSRKGGGSDRRTKLDAPSVAALNHAGVGFSPGRRGAFGLGDERLGSEDEQAVGSNSTQTPLNHPTTNGCSASWGCGCPSALPLRFHLAGQTNRPEADGCRADPSEEFTGTYMSDELGWPSGHSRMIAYWWCAGMPGTKRSCGRSNPMRSPRTKHAWGTSPSRAMCKDRSRVASSPANGRAISCSSACGERLG